ncbi:MAG TPA: 7-carboxy-7-deazaguanine synthase QueE [Candidatus Omnitrophota bacterium]|nr:7-carboxy-7-deazaguanine synthase QueE [Candidatus Omnitrophota bacterium]HQL41124.1 7-carboxy-7-deazaguanine synthase QueE [Candidatus Omnitrophota bacterium]
MITARISEVFSSIQGEGKYVGRRQVFIRFFGCQLGCRVCDTPQGREDSYGFRTYSRTQLLKEVSRFSKVSGVSLTGGEPLEQAGFLKIFLPLLRRKKMPIYLETNGILVQELKDVIHLVDIIAMDIKLPSVTGQGSFWKEHERFLRVAKAKDVFVKIVVGLATPLSEIARAAKLASCINRDIVFILQPQHDELGAKLLQHCFAAQEKALRSLSDARVVAQMHKLLKVR